MILRLLLFWLLASPLAAQGFAGLGTQSDGFAVPQRGLVFEFPADHGAHPEYRIEWWYLTATLQDAEGTHYGLQWTLFRSALAPRSDAGWDNGQLWMGHAAVTTPEAHYVSERRARGGIGQAGIGIGAEFDAWIDDWHLKGASDLASLKMRASGTEFAYDMQLKAAGPLVFQGESGYSVKSEAGQASYYYSQPFFEISGSLTLPDGPVQVAGQAWLDREWSSQPLAADQTGWDWFSLSFDDGARMMGFLLRSEEGASFSSATWIDAEGTATPFENGAFRAQILSTSTVAKRQIPTSWAVQLPARGVDVKVRALNPQSWMETSVPYWEGPISIEGSHSGRGYLEMTGY